MDAHPHEGHYSEGQHRHHDAESDRVGSFAAGQQHGEAEAMPPMSRYSEGLEQDPAADGRVGSFADEG